MEKLQWFKFSYADWRMGKIQRCPEITQSRFINLCCLYWSKDCILSYEDAEIEIDKEHLELLINKKVVSNIGGFINISFLDEQQEGIQETQKGKSNSGKVGNLKRWHKDIYKRYESKEITLNEAFELSQNIADQSHTDCTPIADQSQNIAEKRRGDKIREEERKEDETINKEQYPHENKFCEDVIKYFNETCKDLANVSKLTPQRISLIEARNKEHGKNVIKNVIMSVNENNFYCGRQSNSDWKATFDWVFKASNFLKIKEDDIVNKPNGFYGLSQAIIQEKINYTMRRQG